MRRLLLTLVPLALVACDRQPVAPPLAVAPSLAAVDEINNDLNHVAWFQAQSDGDYDSENFAEFAVWVGQSHCSPGPLSPNCEDGKGMKTTVEVAYFWQQGYWANEYYCGDTVEIDASAFTWNVNEASVVASTACGDLNLTWVRSGPVRHFAQLWWFSSDGRPFGCGNTLDPAEQVLVVRAPNVAARVSGTIDGLDVRDRLVQFPVPIINGYSAIGAGITKWRVCGVGDGGGDDEEEEP